MGLCKCPKRRVTNLFCFEHRVNVCEHCMVTNHPKCIVQSYILWLHDHDYNPVCSLCSTYLNEGDCVRLTCYHMFHWACLDKYARELPATTAPAGYTCPFCKERIFPDAKLVSPVADVLREKLAGVNWARAGLGLPLLSDDREQEPEQERPLLRVESTSYPNHTMTTSTAHSVAISRSASTVNSVHANINSVHLNNQKVGPPCSILNIDSSSGMSTPMSRKVCEAYDDPKELSFDHDENKYKRKSAIEWLLRWWKLIASPTTQRRNTPGSLYKKYAVVGIMGVLAFIGMVILFSWFGRMATDGDPSYDLSANPNILVDDNKPADI
ncbi:zinc finger protein-like 1 [Colletes gigas]|uniref:zinc finger protein-like 1 n=1 Tax=Colletes gigas TaxID=935657 RepID=UPI001C9B68D5|nr:zinc finger protein-like 1 [Colletes gigas]